MRRREFLTAAGTASTVAVAGCSVGSSTGDDEGRTRRRRRRSTPRRLWDVAVDVYFHDGRTFVDDGLDDTPELGPGAEWEFDVPYPGDRQWDTYVGITKYER